MLVINQNSPKTRQLWNEQIGPKLIRIADIMVGTGGSPIRSIDELDWLIEEVNEAFEKIERIEVPDGEQE